MALYHLSTSVGSCSGGQSASAKDDYIEREGRYDGDQSEVEHVEHGHLPGWAAEAPHGYWEAADAYERANGRLYREVEFALPTELTRGERVEVAQEFAHFLTDGERLPYTLAMHRGGGTNPHCHLMISERSNDGMERKAETWFKRYNGKHPERGGARKVSTSSREWLQSTREAWAEHANRALERSGSGERIDHRSLSEQAEEARKSGDLEKVAELSREPGRHLGPGAAIEEKFWQGESKEPSRAAETAQEVSERNDQWVQEWEGVERPRSRMQEDIERLRRELARVEALIKDLVRRIAERVKWERVMKQAEQVIRGSGRPRDDQPKGGQGRELGEQKGDRDMCR